MADKSDINNTVKVTSGGSDRLDNDVKTTNVVDTPSSGAPVEMPAEVPSDTSKAVEGAVYRDTPKINPEMMASRSEVTHRHLESMRKIEADSIRVRFKEGHTLNGIPYKTGDEILVNESVAKSLEASKTVELV